MDDDRRPESPRTDEAHYRRFFESAPVGLFRNAADGRLLDVNPALVRILGFPDRESLLRQDAASLYVDPEDRRRVLVQLQTTDSVNDLEVRARRCDGSMVWVSITARAVRDNDGGLVGLEGSVTDIGERRQAEEALQRESRFISALLDTLGALVVVLDCEGRIVRFNRACQQLTGYREEEALGRFLWDLLLPPDELEGVREVFDRLAAGQFPNRYENDWVARDGSRYRIEWSNTVLPDDRGGVIYVVGTGLDVTERRRAEQALRESEEQFRSLAESSPNMIFINQAGRVVYANRKCEEVMGYTRQQFYDPSFAFMTLIAPESRDAVERSFRAHSKGEQVPACEYELVTCSGRQLTAIHTTALVDYQGSPAILGIVTDITERKQVEQALAAERERLSTTLSSIRDGVVALDAAGHIIFVNPAGEQYLQVLGQARAGDVLYDLGGRPLAELMSSPGEGRACHEVVVQAPRRRVFEVVPQPSETEAAGSWVLVLRDVTLEREMQERAISQERLAAVGQLAAGVAHDFNNILQGILGSAELLQRRLKLAEQDERYLDSIHREGARAARLVRRILDYSRRSISRQHQVELATVVLEATSLLRDTIPEHIAMSVRLEPGEHWVQADPAQLQEALVNLVVNARDAMPVGGKLELSLTSRRWKEGDTLPLPEMQPGQWAVLGVTDTGVGISDQVLPRIFEPFFTTKHPTQGTGLGLPQVYGILQQHRGFIRVDTEPGRGTTFSVYLPLIPRPLPDVTEPGAEEMPEGAGELVLVVEDDEIVLEVVRQMLEALDYRVLTARHGQEALQVYAACDQEIALVLTDLVMPRMGGLELLRALREQGCGAQAMVMTGYPHEREELAALEDDALIWLEKPIDQATLARAVDEALVGD